MLKESQRERKRKVDVLLKVTVTHISVRGAHRRLKLRPSLCHLDARQGVYYVRPCGH